jgi:hypothetical protein
MRTLSRRSGAAAKGPLAYVSELQMASQRAHATNKRRMSTEARGHFRREKVDCQDARRPESLRSLTTPSFQILRKAWHRTGCVVAVDQTRLLSRRACSACKGKVSSSPPRGRSLAEGRTIVASRPCVNVLSAELLRRIRRRVPRDARSLPLGAAGPVPVGLDAETCDAALAALLDAKSLSALPLACSRWSQHDSRGFRTANRAVSVDGAPESLKRAFASSEI